MEPPPPDFAAMFSEMCPGDVDAQEFCHTILGWGNLLDDMDDGEVKKWPLRELSRVYLRLIWTFASCPFYRRNCQALWPVILSSARAYIDSHHARHDARMQEVLAVQYQDVFFAAARLCGGWEHEGRMSAKYRHIPA